MNYTDFLKSKVVIARESGFDVPTEEINPALRLAGLLPTMTYNSATITEAMRALVDSGLPLFPPIRRTPKVDDMTFEQKPLIYSSPRSAACIDYRAFVKVYSSQKGGARRG